MTERRYPRDRGAGKTRLKPRDKKARPSRPRETRNVHLAPYGKIPHLRTVYVRSDGRTGEWWRPDPDYQPPLPQGAVRGDIHRQVFWDALRSPKYFYVDEDRRCLQCDQTFTFKAAEQKYWYETLKFNLYVVPVRCLRCRRHRRTGIALNRAVADAKNAVKSAPDDPASHLALARAIVRLHERLGVGKLADAVAAARRAAVLWPQSSEPKFWEGMAHLLAGRTSRARNCLSAFLKRAKASPTTAGLVPEARRKLANIE